MLSNLSRYNFLSSIKGTEIGESLIKSKNQTLMQNTLKTIALTLAAISNAANLPGRQLEGQDDLSCYKHT